VFRKQCIQTYNVYDFLRDVVSKVPDTGTSDAIADDKLGKRRKSEEDGSDEELKRTRNVSHYYPQLHVDVSYFTVITCFHDNLAK